MERPLFIGERIMHANGDSPVNCVFPFRIKAEITLNTVQNALNNLQKKHPLLRATLHAKKSGPVFVFHQSLPPIPIRIVARVRENMWEEEIKKEWKTSFSYEDGPLARVVWIKSADTSELLLVCPHVITDGTSLVTLARELLLLIDDPTFEIGHSEALTSLSGLFPEADLKKNKIKAALVALMGHLFLPLAYSFGKTTNGKSYAITWKLPHENTSPFIQMCKSEKVSVHAALCCAALLAFRQVLENKARGKVISPADIRRFIPQIKQDTMFAFAPTVNLMISHKKNLDFWELSRSLNVQLLEQLEKIDVPNMITYGERVRSLGPKIIRLLKKTSGSHDVTLSNMGRVDIPESYHSLEVELLSTPTVAFPWKNPNTCVICTYKGEMHFSFMSNESYLASSDAKKIKADFLEIIRSHTIREDETQPLPEEHELA
ncbi:MAG: condensation domain-containing protein [Bacteroidota bacterium]